MRAQELSYNGRQLHEFFVERAAAYVSQVRGEAWPGLHRSLFRLRMMPRQRATFAALPVRLGWRRLDLSCEHGAGQL